MGKGRICGVYEIRNLRNNMLYIGSSVDVRRRWARHRSSLDRKKHCNRHLQAAWLKYGEDAFSFSLLFECSRADLRKREQGSIDAVPWERLYNQVRTTVPIPRTDASSIDRQKLSLAARKRWKDPAYRESVTQNMARAARKRWKDPEQRESLLESLRNNREKVEHSPHLKKKIAKDLGAFPVEAIHPCGKSEWFLSLRRVAPYKSAYRALQKEGDVYHVKRGRLGGCRLVRRSWEDLEDRT